MERVVQFDTKRKTSPGLDMLAFYSQETGEMRKQASTDAAWLSSARGVGSEKRPIAPVDSNVKWKIRLISVKLIDFWVTFG